MICQNCKAEVAGSPKFCPKCGTKLDVSTVQTPALSTLAMAESAPASVAPQDSVICPKCGTPNLPTARFCKKDGIPLRGETSSQQPAAPLAAPQPVSQPMAPRTQTAFQPDQHPTSQSRKTILIVSMVAVVMLTSGIGGYLWWAGYVGDRQGSVAQTLNAELSRKGLGSVKVNVDKDWKTAVEGQVASQAEKDQALALLNQHKKLKIIDNIRVKPSRADMEQRINKALADAGMKQVTAQIDERLTKVTLNDPDLGPEDRAKAEKVISSVTTDVVGTTSVQVAHAVPTPQPPAPLPAPSVATAPSPASPPVDVTSIESGLNEALRSEGLSGVSARVDANGNVNLQGAVATREDKDRATRLALSQAGVTGVSDFMNVAPPASSAAIAPTAPPVPPQAKAPARPRAKAPALPQSPPDAVVARSTITRDPAKLEGEINRALRRVGVGGVSAQVGDDFSITLKGSTTSVAQKDQAFQIARQFKGVGAVKDRVFVVEQ